MGLLCRYAVKQIRYVDCSLLTTFSTHWETLDRHAEVAESTIFLSSKHKHQIADMIT